ncbi:aldo/keto reductase [Streptomyces sp. NPDC016172]|uniref:aldo/keto reductase n=1 Tax=Streptomyces sp. NPDC016172 TaxID=3364964 RepID=UPI0036FAA0CD
MRYRRLGRLGHDVSEVGYGMWGIAGGEGGWSGADDARGLESLQAAVDHGCNFFDTAWIYGRGHSEEMLAEALRANMDRRLVVATKVPPKDRAFPSTRASRLEQVFPSDHIRAYTERSLANLGVGRIDLLQFHVWEDAWAQDPTWQRTVTQLKDEGLIGGIGISVNRWEPWNVLRTLDTGLIDAVQVIYNIFDQAPEDELFDACAKHDVGVIARVPFDEGTLTGTLTAESTWPEGDWRNSYFVPENLVPAVERAERLKALTPAGTTLPEMALRFILDNPAIDTVIPGMRSVAHVRTNLAVSDQEPLPADLTAELKGHRWDRQPTEWSQ